MTCENSLELAALIHAGALELALVTDHDGLTGFELVREEPLVWTAATRFKVAEGEPIPLALGSSACVWRKVADEALEGRRERVRGLFVSKNYTAIGSVVRAGLAATVLPQGMLGDGLRPLGPEWGLPRLPMSRMGLIRSASKSSEEVIALAEAVRGTIGQAGRIAA